MRSRRSRTERAVSATQLAEMGYCEQRMLLAHRLGERTTPAQRQARARGDAAHLRYFAQGAAAKDRRCFVASCVFGPDALETQQLRGYRDAVLLPRWWGRCLVAVYYRTAPCVCRLLERWPAALSVTRLVLRKLIVMCCNARAASGKIR
jgi:hypothetical protein